jgi:hypothetical protein
MSNADGGHTLKLGMKGGVSLTPIFQTQENGPRL